MSANNIKVVMSIPDTEVAEKFMTKAFTELIGDKIKKLSLEQRKEFYEEIFQVTKNNCVDDNK